MKSKYIKGIILGLCISAFSTSVAFAQAVSSDVSATNEVVQTEGTKELMEKQRQIDQYLFEDHAKDLEAKDIFVNYTGIVEDYIEIGISPFNDENANYLYDALGKDGIKVVEFDQSVIYQSGAAVDDKMYKDGDVQIQIESVDDQAVTDDQTGTGEEDIYYTTGTEDNNQGVTDVKTVSNPESMDAGSQNTEKSSNTGYVAFIAVAVAAIGGLGTILIRSNTKKSMK
ncbi:MAG: hypothetical protein K0S04_2603 [Herbinix sp.]|jgi:hypothetical protein|nr:hypothetical protein [Herbinix sp.]